MVPVAVEDDREAKRLKQTAPEPSSFEQELTKLTQDIKSSDADDQKWARPGMDKWDSSKQDLTFQQLDAEEATLDGDTIVRMFGITMEGHSVLCNITGFKHYLYVAAPVGFRQSDIPALKASMDNVYPRMVDRVEIAMKESLWGFSGNVQSPFLRIIVTDPRNASKIRGQFERDPSPFAGFENSGPQMTYDNIAYILRLMVDCNVTGMCWLTCPAGKYTVSGGSHMSSSISTCQLEVTISYHDLVSHPSEGQWLSVAPLRILSFDIECAGRKGIFPDAKIDPVIQIANVVKRQGDTRPFVRNVFTVNTCSQIVGSQVFEHTSEQAMLKAWRDFVVEVDPDVIIGYNTANFDLPYLLDRADALSVKEFPFFGRLRNVKQVAKESTFSSKAYGTRESKVINIDGRLQIDMLQYLQREYKLRSYTLNAVSAHFLNEQKEDVHHSIITELQNGTAESRRRLAVYCLKDAYLPLRLMDKLMTLVNYTEMARVTGVPFSFLLSRGQQIKVISQLYRKALQVNLLTPNLRQEGSSDEQYEGATVIDPIRGYYDVPIATLDFSSLYPSIMMAHNLCYTTLVDKTTINRLGLVLDKDYIITPNNDMFVKSDKRKGILPIILEELLGARKKAKADLKKETDPFRRAVLDGRQLALKISANSVYGFTGATIGKLPCLAISSSVTAFGRKMIEKTKNEVEQHYTISNGYKHNAQVVYGDTDSVMIKFGPSELEECMELGREAAGLVTEKFQRPINLEFEKVYYPYLLINKKRYAGLYWTNSKNFDKMDTKGIETVRRDNCRLVQIVIETVLKKILMDHDTDGAERYVKQIISDLLQNKVDLSLLVISKALSRSDYAGKQAHVELAERMRKRDAGSAPNLGDRVAYVIIKGSMSGKNYEKSEDPIYVLENNLPIDTKYYLENQLAKPLERIFEPILGEQRAQQLLTGQHTRTISVATPTSGGLMRFAVKTELCKGCKRPLKGKWAKGAVCEDCVELAPELYRKELSQVNSLETKFARLWTQCQRCQGSLHQDVLCTSSDCPLFYMRKKAQKELQTGINELKKFDNTDW